MIFAVERNAFFRIRGTCLILRDLYSSPIRIERIIRTVPASVAVKKPVLRPAIINTGIRRAQTELKVACRSSFPVALFSRALFQWFLWAYM